MPIGHEFAPPLLVQRAVGLNLPQPSSTFMTHVMKVTGNDVGTVMKYGGHRMLESFSNYIHPTDEGRIVSMQALDNVDGILTAQGGVESVRSVGSAEERAAKLLQNKQLAV